MREIKFRAWDRTHRRWQSLKIAGLLISGGNDSVELHSDDLEIMQYTGLKDKNGVEIYEGDIVQYFPNLDADDDDDQDREINILQVLWTNDCYGGKWGFDLAYSDGSCRNFYYGGFYTEQTVVIGNIYENPELLGGKDGEN